MKAGDIFRTVLKDGRYGAVRILKTGGKFDFSPFDFHLIGITPFVGAESPSIENPALQEILVKEFLSPKGHKIINIHCGEFPKELKYIGNIPISEKEQNLEIKIGNGTDGGFPSCGTIQPDIGYEALIEWRYKFDTEAFLEFVEASRNETAKLMRKLRKSKPKKMLDNERFWKIISLLDWSHQGSDEKVLEPAVKELAKLKTSEIKHFEEALAFKLFQLDTKGHAQNIGEYSYNETDEFVSADLFLYARCAVVANGREFYEKTLSEPTEMIKNIEFEALLTLSALAYELKTGQDLEYDTGISYETFSNHKAWE